MYSTTCASCHRAFVAERSTANTCSDRCRVKLYRDRLTAQRARLAAQATAAADARDINALEAVARRTAALLAA